ncbi:FTR1 family protein [Ruminococcus sp.]|uniref:FTR1 family protein n=1 Tax=Ruminococcus sp. TaxID=41978 RepID=UPI0025DF9DA9|nr:FTR1 family protein [Ruminococcus sp.]MBQ8966078.1 FTR1 family protein [Ruminococcus sp.]
MSCKKFGLTAVVSLLTAVMLSLFATVITASASAEYAPTWEEYKAAGNPASTWNDVADSIDKLMEASYQLYAAGDTDAAYTPILNSYNFYYETSGFERNVNGYSGSEVSKAELQFKTARKSVKKGAPIEEVKENFNALSEILHTQANHLDGLGDTGESKLTFGEGAAAEETVETNESTESTAAQTETAPADTDSTPLGSGTTNVWVTFASCFAIILREGLEAILVVGAIIAYLVKSGNKNKLKHVYIGCIAAIGASFLCAWLLSLLKLANTANQEIIEGVTALTAVLVLFYVSNWMVSKAEADSWNKYIDEQVKASAETGSVFTLAFTAFLAVFREGAEVILFYQPLLNDAKSMSYVWGGFGVGCVVLAVVFLCIRFLSVKLPVRPFFLGTSILMFIMSISFLGAGIKELIEGDVIDMTSPEWLQNIIPFNDVLNVLGIYPVLETLIPQLILIFVTLMIFVMQKFKVKNKNEAGILAILFGSLGGHKFYLGKYGQGLICVAFCWSGIPALLGIIQGVHYLTETQEQFEEELAPKKKAPKIKAGKK